MRLITILLASVIFATAYAGHHEEKNNVAIIDKFFATVFTDTVTAKSLLHEDFTFTFMGICTICKSYNKDTYIDARYKGNLSRFANHSHNPNVVSYPKFV